ncbi:hypothetical protein ACVMH6_007034 [Rhizobium leguminosarum]
MVVRLAQHIPNPLRRNVAISEFNGARTNPENRDVDSY